MTEKIESIREDLVHDSKTMDGIAKIFQKDYEDSNPKRLPLLISFFTLTKSLGRSLEMNKKIVSNSLSEESDFFEKTGKLLISCDT